MTLCASDVRARLCDAYSALIRDDKQLLEVDANERSITHKLAEHLQHQFPDWDVDCEYNRVGALPKRLKSAVESIRTDDAEGRTVYPDIIVHHRGCDDNLLVIEAKKKSTDHDNNDTQKLKAYKDEHGYRFAYAVIFRTGTAANSADASTDVKEVDA